MYDSSVLAHMHRVIRDQNDAELAVAGPSLSCVLVWPGGIEDAKISDVRCACSTEVRRRASAAPTHEAPLACC